MVISKTGFLHINSHLGKEDIVELDHLQDGWCLSLYMPIHHDGREVNQGPILLRDLDVQARRELALRGLSPREIEVILAPVERLLEADFPHLEGRGLAVLSSRGGSACFLLPDDPGTRVEVDVRFRIEPLIPILIEEDRFFLLALGLHGVRFWEGNRAGLREIPLHGAHLHAPQTPLIGKRDAEGYCREIDAALQQRMRGRQYPLILAGIHPLLSLFRKTCTYPHLLEQAVTGNPESESVGHHLHAEAWKRLKAARALELEKSLIEYREGLASERTAAGITDVVPCAVAGRVRDLFIQKGYEAWGTFDAETGQVIPLAAPTLRAVDMGNLACLKTLLGGGRVHVLESGQLPSGAKIAALLRY